MYRVDKEKVRNIGIQLLIIILSCFFGILGYIIYLDSQIYVYEKSAVGTRLLREIEKQESEESENLIEQATKSLETRIRKIERIERNRKPDFRRRSEIWWLSIKNTLKRNLIKI